MQSPILGPVVALALWTMIVMIWMFAARMPALKAAGIALKGRVGGRPGALDGVIAESAQWKAHNYMHLLEQPTLFYAVTLALAVAGFGAGLNAQLAWLYVVLRIGHSLVQATVNIIIYRLTLFWLSSLVLLILVVRAALVVYTFAG